MESSEAEFSNKIVFNTTIESMGNDTVSNTSNTTTTDSFGELNLISYRYLMPAISAFGIIGNLIILLVLTSKELQMVSTNRQKVSQRSQSMFIYMKVLAVIDIFELIWTYQGAHFTLNGYWRVTAPAPIPTKAMANYVWNYMEPVWKTFMHSSDFVLVAMTVVRFQIVNTAHKFKRNESNGTLKSVCYCSIAVLLGLALNLPHFIHYDIVECDTIENCWTHKSSAISETVFWDVFGYLYVVLGKVLPFILIAVLDVIIFIKMKRIFKKRKRFRSTRRAALAMTTRTSITTDAEGTTPGIESSYEMQSFGDSNMTTTTKIIHKKKEKENQLKLTKILLLLGLFHFLTTLMETLGYFILTFYRSAWLSFKHRSTYATIANVLVNVNYAKNFYLYCLVHEDIRRITMSKLIYLLRKLRCK